MCQDDGYIAVNIIDANAKKSVIYLIWAKNMVVEFKGRAPELSLFGLHGGFFPYNIGCSQNDCRPQVDSSSHRIQNVSFILFVFLLKFF